MSHVVVTAPDVTDSSISGQGMRHLGIARSLAQEHQVDVLASGNPGQSAKGINIVSDPRLQRALLHTADYVLTANSIARRQLPVVQGRFIFDLYDPSIIESLIIEALRPGSEDLLFEEHLWALKFALKYGFRVLCANDSQRDLYTGMLFGRRFGRRTVGITESEILQKFIIVPNGVDFNDLSQLPDRMSARKRLGIASDAIVLLWGGGVWDWLDPFTVVKAVKSASIGIPELRLFFLGLKRGGAEDPNSRNAEVLLEFCRKSGVLGTCVEANLDWVDPQTRADYLAASDAGIIGQGNHLEARYAFRTRLMDCLWAGIPVFSAGSDPLTEQGVREGWAISTPSSDAVGLAEALVRFGRSSAWRGELRASAQRGRERRTWNRTTESLRADIGDPIPLPFDARMRRGSAAILGIANRRFHNTIKKVFS